MDSWNQDQLKLMSLGGNGRAHAFFTQHGWTDGGRIEAKYTSRAADLYRQLLVKEVAKSVAAAASSVSQKSSDESPSTKPEDSFTAEQQLKDLADPTPVPSPAVKPTTAPRPTPALSARSSSFGTRKPTSALGAKKIGATKPSSLGVKKLTTKVHTHSQTCMNEDCLFAGFQLTEEQIHVYEGLNSVVCFRSPVKIFMTRNPLRYSLNQQHQPLYLA